MLVAFLLGILFDRLRLPPFLGQILGGFLVGSLLFPLLSRMLTGRHFHVPDFSSPAFDVLGTLGLILLMLVSGLEVKEKELLSAGKHSLLTAIGGFIFPLGAGLLLGSWFGWQTRQGIVLGLMMAPTSIGITAVTLVELNRLRTGEGLTMLGAAIIDDVMVIVAAAVVLATGSITVLSVQIIAFFLLIWILGKFLIPRLVAAGYRTSLKGSGAAFVLVITIFTALLAESFDVALVTGAFLTGMFLASSSIKEKIAQDIETIAASLFIPLFFFLVGVRIDAAALSKSGPLLLAVIPVSILAKSGGAFLGARVSGLSRRNAFAVGLGMGPRLEFPIIIALLAARKGFFSNNAAQELFGMTMGMVTFSIIATPLLLRWIYSRRPEVVEEIHEHPTQK